MSARSRSVALAVAWRGVRLTFTTPALILPMLTFPLFFLAAFAGGISGIERAPGFDFASGYTAFVFVFVLLQSAAFGGVFTGFGIARDFESGFARRLMLAAPRRAAILAGYALSGLARAAATMAVATAAALVGGMQVGGGGVDLFGMYALAFLVNVAATLWAAGVAMRLRTLQAGPLMQVPVFLVLLLAPVYVPLDLLAGWVHALAQVNPMTVLLKAGRGLISGAPADVALAFAIAAALIAAFAAWARGGLRSAEASGA